MSVRENPAAFNLICFIMEHGEGSNGHNGAMPETPPPLMTFIFFGRLKYFSILCVQSGKVRCMR